MILKDCVEILVNAERIGAITDVPEGTRYICISDTLTGQMIRCLESLPVLEERPDYE